MVPISQVLNVLVIRNLRILQPQQMCLQQISKYSEKIRDAGKAKENVHFLKMQREQLKELRKKILKERELLKDKISELDKQIEDIKKKNSQKQAEKQ
ncbi:maker123 [Drosophila busckii]|uniref:Maker123 n=1 Tax=Drosophila busckii TaxID=30019 RepID=A0A0M4EBA2_DROBS|nr:uncharacterized protein LOC108595953 [Drosophila busckii]ALC42496.1 maker123 [Drosophila busckii]